MKITQVWLWRKVEGGGVAGVDIPISSSRLLHLQRGDRGQNTLPSSYFDSNANIILMEIFRVSNT